MRKITVVGNWKMHTTLAEAHVLAKMIANQTKELTDLEIVLCPPFVWLLPLKEDLSRHAHLKLGAQNMAWELEGAYTGEVSATMLKGLVNYVIVGHSERRRYFGEDNHTVHAKVLTALNAHLTPIVAVGEEEPLPFKNLTQEKIEENFTKTRLAEQIRQSLKGLKDDLEKVVIAYEPVWAIGAKEPATGGYTNLVIGLIRKLLARMSSREVAERVRILYGGSIDSKNAAEILWQPEVDGVLVGRASLKAREFVKICEVAAGSPRIKGL